MNTTLFLAWFAAIFVYTMILQVKRDNVKSEVISDAIYSAIVAFFFALIGYSFVIPLTISGSSFTMFLLATFCMIPVAVSERNYVRALVPSFVLIVLYIVTSTFWFNASEMGNLIKTTEIKTPLFTEVEEADQRLVPKSVVISAQEKAVNGRLPDGSMIATMYALDTSANIIQEINDKKYYVTPLTWSSFTKYALNDYSIIGYVLSSATESGSESKLITKNPDGSDINMVISKNGYFSANLERNIIAKYGSVLIADSYFMLDDNMYPYYVSYKIKPEIGIDNHIPDGVYVTDPQTREIKYFEQDEIPSFIDTHAAEETLIDLADMWGDYREGLTAALGSKIELSVTSFNSQKELFFVDAANTVSGNAYFTGMENPKSNGKSLSAMMFIDAVSLETYIYYPEKEAQNETAVIDSVRSALGNLSDKWEPTQPIPYRLYGETDVWLTPIVSKQGSSRKVEAYAYTKVFSTDKSVWDYKLSNAMTKLLTLDGESGNVINKDSVEAIQGTLRTIYFVNDSAYLTLNELPVIIECNHQSVIECRGLKLEQSISFDAMSKNERELVLLAFSEDPLK